MDDNPNDGFTPTETNDNTYEVQDGDDLVEIFGAGFEVVSSSAWVTPLDRVRAYEAGYKLKTVPGEKGWSATR